jgi:hypothetical protein
MPVAWDCSFIHFDFVTKTEQPMNLPKRPEKSNPENEVFFLVHGYYAKLPET